MYYILLPCNEAWWKNTISHNIQILPKASKEEPNHMIQTLNFFFFVGLLKSLFYDCLQSKEFFFLLFKLKFLYNFL